MSASSSTMPIAEAEKIHKYGTDDGWHGKVEAGSPAFQPEKGRYHLYIGLFCPFAHRANLVRHIKGLTDIIDLSVVKPFPKGDDKGWPGWQFPESETEYPAATTDQLFGSKFLHENYFRVDPDYKGRYSVPVLWDKKHNTIINNESAELLRDLPLSFNSILPARLAEIDLYPEAYRSQIDEITPWMQSDVNAGVYKAGFATDEGTYQTNCIKVFAALNKLERMCFENSKKGPYFLGEVLTELDLRLYATLIRFDPVYVQHFKCNLGMIRTHYPVLHNWLKNLYWNVPGFKESTDFKHIKENYTKSHAGINPYAITPVGPLPNIESGVVQADQLKPGGVDMPAVLEAEKFVGDSGKGAQALAGFKLS